MYGDIAPHLPAALQRRHRLLMLMSPDCLGWDILTAVRMAPVMRSLMDVVELVPVAVADADVMQMLVDLLFGADVADAFVSLAALDLQRRNVMDVLMDTVTGLQVAMVGMQRAVSVRRVRSSTLDVALRAQAVTTAVNAVVAPSFTITTVDDSLDDLMKAL